jgi:L-ascorbate metabolism protein UlaG (beta-lactamase superfamily)
LVEVQFLGHSFFKIKFSGTNILIDPFISSDSGDPAFKRLIKCPLKESQLKNVALILVSHEHFDHCDKKFIEKIAKKEKALVVATQHVLNDLDLPGNLSVAVCGGDKKVLQGIEIEVHAAHHPQSFYPISFLLKKDGKSIFHAGDTALTSAFESIKADVALLPIGGTFTMDVVDAVKATKTIKPETVIPMHYNTFKMIKAEPLEFVQKINKSILQTKPLILQPGEKVKLK